MEKSCNYIGGSEYCAPLVGKQALGLMRWWYVVGLRHKVHGPSLDVNPGFYKAGAWND
jgi:hypothetical protein